MNPLTRKLTMKEGAAFVPFVVVGHPDLDTSALAVTALIEEGADFIELGVPYSDALADGPVIQQASETAAKSISLQDVLSFACKMSEKHPSFPFVLFTYLNPILKIGIQKFAELAASSGIYAVLVVDLPPEEAGEYKQILASKGLKTVFLASPTTAPERLKLIADSSTAFIYYVSRTGVTGEQRELSSSLEMELRQLRRLTDRPLAVGFGISNPTQARQVASLGDAVVVGSAFVRILSDPTDPKRALGELRNLARSLSSAIAG